MTWRRIAPWVILITLLLAIFIDLPREFLPSSLPGNDIKTVLGLDLQGGIRVTLEVEPLPGQTVTDEQLETARNIIERRVGGIGVSEPQVRTEISTTASAGSWSRCRASRTRTRSASWSARPDSCSSSTRGARR